MFGTNEKFDLTHAVYARSGSAYYIIENYYTHLLQLSTYKPGAWLSSTPYLFDIKLLRDGVEMKYEYFGDPGSLRLDCDGGWAEFIFTEYDYMRVHGSGVTLRIELDPAVPALGTSACHGVCRFADNSVQAVFGTYGKLLYRPLLGSVETDCPRSAEKNAYEKVIIDLVPDADGCFDAAVHETMTEFDNIDIPYISVDQLKKEGWNSYNSFKSNYRAPAKGYEKLWDYAIHTVWARRVKTSGYFKSPMIMMHYEYLGEAFSWQQSYNGMSMMGDPREGWREICTMFEYQNEQTGQLPGNVGFMGPNAGIQPPIQGFALDFLIRKAGDSFLTPSECERMYPKFAKWADFWTTYRSAGRGDDVTAINNPNDSGWDDATIFRDGFPAVNPDLIAFMILLLEAVGRLARGCGKLELADSWQARSEKLLRTLIDEFWDGDKFVTYARGKKVESMSLACFQPIMLGSRLPTHIIDRMTEQLLEEGNFLCEMGLCSESLKSPLCSFGTSTFVSGRVVAPAQIFITAGLHLAGRKKEAAMIARRFCDTVKERGCILGFAPYDYYPLTGEKADITPGPVASDGWPWSSWSACNTLTMITCIIPEGEE
ncbi:MAG: hypothetical protein K5855_09470 [Oscillospiraceae bacterium]|jgi:hypothetical protein|nr:hypothetical protein [Oscillospiraceae bacterium]